MFAAVLIDLNGAVDLEVEPKARVVPDGPRDEEEPEEGKRGGGAGDGSGVAARRQRQDERNKVVARRART